MQKGIVIGIVAAACLMMGCTGQKSQRLQQLEELEATNRAGKELLNDSLAEELVDYFDRHGSSNERMRSRYMLGRTYYFMGELPRALEIYNEAADCADTTAADCDFARLSRVYAQKAAVFHKQVQPRSQQKELRLAEYFAKKGKDTLMAIECYALQAQTYEYLHIPDSVIIVTDNSYDLFQSINRRDRSYQVISNEIPALVKRKIDEKTWQRIIEYEEKSGFFDELGNIKKGLEVYYYYKGCYFLSINKLDSAEYLFRKELRDGKDLNNQIAGCKGLQEVFEQKKSVDSIAKYSALAYELNDSAYSLSEMQNIQKFQASYNYNHNKFLVEQKRLEAKIAWLILILIVIIVLIIGFLFVKRYLEFRKAALDHRLKRSEIACRLKKLANANPPGHASFSDWKQLRIFVEHEIPSFRKMLKVDELPLSDMEYDICLAIRVGIQPQEISKLKNCSPSLISKTRKSLLMKIFQQTGSSEDFDDEIGKIRG